MANFDNEAAERRIALVTGASRGIGRAMALALAKNGAHVVALARTQGALEELDDEIRSLPGTQAPTLLPFDLKDADAIDRVGFTLHQRFGRLDALVAAAGLLGPLTPLSHVDPKHWQDVLAINLTANWRLIRALDPLLRASRSGRAVFFTSGASDAAARAYFGPYAASKAGLNALASVYAAETKNTSNVRVTLVDPGPIRTRMRAAAFPGEDPNTLPTPEALGEKVVRFCGPEWTETGLIYDFPRDALVAFVRG